MFAIENTDELDDDELFERIISKLKTDKLLCETLLFRVVPPSFKRSETLAYALKHGTDRDPSKKSI